MDADQILRDSPISLLFQSLSAESGWSHTVRPMPESVVHDFPAGGWRVKEPATGIMATIVNGEVLMENGKHTGALPGRVLRNTYYNAHA